MLRHDGVYHWKHLPAEPLLDDDGKFIDWYIVAVKIDVTVKAQEAPRASEKEARELLDRLPGRFLTRTKQDFELKSAWTTAAVPIGPAQSRSWSGTAGSAPRSTGAIRLPAAMSNRSGDAVPRADLASAHSVSTPSWQVMPHIGTDLQNLSLAISRR